MGQGGSTVGAQLEERYFLQKVKLGQGSFGTVWRAVDRHSSQTVAIKQLDKASLPRRGVTRQDIEREINMMKACSHENITKLFDTFEDDKSIFLALEYCDGGDFGDKVKERGMFAAEPEVAEWMRQMCSAINAMHSKSICHRDVKPDNFMVQGAGTLKLSDFGLAIYLPKGKLLQEKCGTPAFMSPEQHNLPRRSAGYSFPADMWAVGVSMYMMMFGGKHPFLNDRGGLDDQLLLNGELDFRDNTSNKLGFFGLAGLGAAPLRFSEEARSFCKRMVDPDPQRRLAAEATAGVPWLQLGVAVAARAPAGAGGAGARAMTPPAPQAAADVQAAAPRGRSATPRMGAAPSGGAAEVGVTEVAAPVVQRVPSSQAPQQQPLKERASTPGPEGRKALAQAQKLKEENDALMSQLEERKRREEELVRQQQRMEFQAKMFQKQKTRELEEIRREKEHQQKQLQAVQFEKEELERQRIKQAAAKAAAGATPTPLGGTSGLAKTRPDKTAMPEKTGPGRLLRRGTKCRYESGTYGWMAAVVQGYNESDGTYNLDVRQHAALDKIAPTGEVTAMEAWPPGTYASYLSTSVNAWLPALINSFNESDCTYNLDVRDHADIDRIRARIDRPADDQGEARRPSHGRPGFHTQETTPLGGVGSEASSASRRGRSTTTTATTADTVGEGAAEESPEGEPNRVPREGRGEMKRATYRVSELEATSAAAAAGCSAPPRWVTKGDVCTIPDHGLVFVESPAGRDGTYTVKVNEKTKLQVTAEVMRAPRESKFAWPPGTKVSYLSASVGKWIDANVVSFNPSGGTYNLDVRPEAAPDKVRPR